MSIIVVHDWKLSQMPLPQRTLQDYFSRLSEPRSMWGVFLHVYLTPPRWWQLWLEALCFWVHLSFCHINVNTISQNNWVTFFKFDMNIHLDSRMNWLDIEGSKFKFTMTSCLSYSHQCNISGNAGGEFHHICTYNKLQLDKFVEALSIFGILKSFLNVHKQMDCDGWIYADSCSYTHIYTLFCTGFDKWGPFVYSS